MQTKFNKSVDLVLLPQCMESFVQRCPNSVTPYLNICVDNGLRFVGWDPNYEAMSGDEGDEMDEDNDSEADEEEDLYVTVIIMGIFLYVTLINLGIYCVVCVFVICFSMSFLFFIWVSMLFLSE